MQTSRLAGSLDFRPFLSQRNCQNIALDNQNPVFLPNKMSKYRLRQPKYIVLWTPKKPDKIPKNGQNRFWVIKQCFLGKIRRKNFDTINFSGQIFFPLILPKQHSLITQKRFWPFFGILSGFLGVHRTIYFGGLSLYFDNFFARKTVGSRETSRDGLLSLVSIVLYVNV